MRPARKIVKSITRGRAGRVIVPLAFEVAAQISARPLDEFRADPTQLTNGLCELQKAINADGIICALGDEMEFQSAANSELDFNHIRNHGSVCASLLACTRLRQMFGDEVALVAGLTGPNSLSRQFNASEADCGLFFTQLVTAFCEAGGDILMIMEPENFIIDAAWKDGVITARNVANFHQVLLMSWNESFLPTPVKQSVLLPSKNGSGIITTDSILPHDSDISTLAQFVVGCREA